MASIHFDSSRPSASPVDATKAAVVLLALPSHPIKGFRLGRRKHSARGLALLCSCAEVSHNITTFRDALTDRSQHILLGVLFAETGDCANEKCKLPHTRHAHIERQKARARPTSAVTMLSTRLYAKRSPTASPPGAPRFFWRKRRRKRSTGPSLRRCGHSHGHSHDHPGPEVLQL